MAKIEWQPSLSLGVPSLDNQNKRFISLANDILQAVDSNREARQVSACFSKLRQLAVYHFAQEENFLRSLGYPEANSHSKEHEELKDLIRFHQERLYREGIVREKDIRDFLRKLLIEHVVYSHSLVRRFLAERKRQDGQAPAA